MLSRRLSKRLKLIALVQLVLLAQCVPTLQPEHTTPALQRPDTISLEVVSEDLQVIQDAVLQTTGSQKEWQQKTDFFRPEGEWGGWVTQLKIRPNLDFGVDRYIENPIRVPTQAEVHGFFLVRNAWKQPHDLRIIFLLDFQQLPVIKSGQTHDFYDLPVMEPQEVHAFEFVLPELSEGFHQLSLLLIADPDSLSTDKSYRFFQQKSFHENRYDLWVDIETLPKDVTSFDDAKLGQAAASRMSAIELVVSAEIETPKPLTSLTLKPGETHSLNLRLFNCGVECHKESEVNALYTGSVPLRIATFWNDKLEQSLNYDLLANAPDNLTFELQVAAPAEAGLYQFDVVVFTFPDYSQFISPTVERTVYPKGIFSRRVLVSVQR